MIWTALTAAGGFLKRVPPVVWLVLAVLLSAWLWGNHRYSQGYDARTAEYVEAARKAESERMRIEREAATDDSKTKQQGTGAIAAQRKELDDAKANLPDQGLTARQRARACHELRRQGKPCEPAAPAR